MKDFLCFRPATILEIQNLMISLASLDSYRSLKKETKGPILGLRRHLLNVAFFKYV